MSDNASLLSDHATLERLRAQFVAFETNQTRVDAFSAQLVAMGLTETLESARLLRGDRTTFTTFCKALRHGTPADSKTFGAPSLLAQHVTSVASAAALRGASPPGRPVRFDLVDTGSTYLLQPLAPGGAAHVPPAPSEFAAARPSARAVARAILTRVETGELTVSGATAELNTAHFPPSDIPELARALQLYVTSGRMDFTRALAGCEAFTTAQIEAQQTTTAGLYGARRIAASPAAANAPPIPSPARAVGLRSPGPHTDVYSSTGNFLTWSGVGPGVSVDDHIAERHGKGMGAYTNLKQSPLKKALHAHSISHASPP
jgi:hypothetical protein